jgi:zinc protease
VIIAKKLKLSGISIYFLATLFLFGQRSFGSAPLPMPEVETLPNGLNVAWFVSDHLPLVDLSLVVRAGTRDDERGKSGTAEFLANSLDLGAGGKSAKEIARTIEALGGVRSVAAEEDTTSISVHGLAPDTDSLLQILGNMVIHPDFPEEEIKKEHARFLDRWAHLGDFSELLSSFAFKRWLAAGTSYGRGNLASVNELKKVTRKDLTDFHKKYFTPKNSVLLVVGRVDKANLSKNILSNFGNWKGEAPKRHWGRYSDPRFPSSLKKGASIVVVNRPGVNQSHVRMGFRAPLIKSPNYYPLKVANTFLGEQFNSRLNSVLRDQMGLTYSIRSGFSYSKDYADFNIVTATRSETTGQLVKKVIEVLREFKEGQITEDEINTAKSYLVGGFPLGNSTLLAVASRWLAGFIYDLGPQYLNEFIPRIQSVTLKEIQSAIKKDFNMDQLYVVVAGDAQEIRKSLKSVQLPVLKQFSIDELR